MIGLISTVLFFSVISMCILIPVILKTKKKECGDIINNIRLRWYLEKYKNYIIVFILSIIIISLTIDIVKEQKKYYINMFEVDINNITYGCVMPFYSDCSGVNYLYLFLIILVCVIAVVLGVYSYYIKELKV